MALLAPPRFKCPPPTRAAVFRELVCGAGSRPGRVNCSISSAAVVDAEHLECLSVGPPPSPRPTLPVTSTSVSSGPSVGANFNTGLTGSFLNGLSHLSFECRNQGGFGEAILNKEAMVAAAAAEAVALARAAAEVAGEVAQMAQKVHRTNFPPRDDTEDSFLARELRRTEVGWESRRAGLELLEGKEFSSIFSDEAEDGDDGGESTEGVVAVKSARRSERRNRRVRPAMKAAKSLTIGNTVGASSSSKKRLKGCRNPLGCLYKMTGPRLLTAKQEVEFSEGIQVMRHKLSLPVLCTLKFF